MKPKHMPPVMEQALREMPHALIADIKDVLAAVPRAMRFHFSEEASTKLGYIISQVEDLILDNHMFAIPPFPTTYIELNARLLYKGAGKRTTDDLPEYNESPGDDEVGYLIDRGRVWVFSRRVDGESGMGPFRFEDSLGHPSFWPKPDAFPQAKELGPDWGRLGVLLGSGIHKISSEEVKSALLQRYTIHPTFLTDGKLPEVYYNNWSTYQSSMGDMRNILAALLILNMPQHHTVTPHQPRPFLYKGRRTVFSSHRTVTITLGETHNVRRLFHQHTGIKHRRHPVKGHFMRIRIDPHCPHDWPFIPEDELEGSPSYKCGMCGGIRKWRKHHDRGDAALGYVTHDYRVKERKEKR